MHKQHSSGHHREGGAVSSYPIHNILIYIAVNSATHFNEVSSVPRGIRNSDNVRTYTHTRHTHALSRRANIIAGGLSRGILLLG